MEEEKKKNSLVIVNFLFSISVSILVWMCLVLVLLLFSNSKQNYSITSKSNSKTCQVFYLDSIASWIRSNRSAIAYQATDQQKHTIILYYYSVFLCHKGRSLHFRTDSRKPATAYLLFSRLNPHF